MICVAMHVETGDIYIKSGAATVNCLKHVEPRIWSDVCISLVCTAMTHALFSCKITASVTAKRIAEWARTGTSAYRNVLIERANVVYQKRVAICQTLANLQTVLAIWRSAEVLTSLVAAHRCSQIHSKSMMNLKCFHVLIERANVD